SVLEDAQGRRVGVDVTAADRLEERAETIPAPTETPLEPATELLVEDVHQLSFPPLALPACTIGVRREKLPVVLERLEEGVEADIARRLREQDRDLPARGRPEVEHL